MYTKTTCLRERYLTLQLTYAIRVAQKTGFIVRQKTANISQGKVAPPLRRFGILNSDFV